MKKIIIGLLLTSIMCCFCACQYNIILRDETSQATETTTAESIESETSNNDYTFNTVADLKESIKHDPYKYYNAKVQVKGTLCKSNGGEITALVDLSEPLSTDYYGVEFRYEVRNNPNIDIVITDEVLYAAAENGDYINVCGIVKINSGEIYLDNCKYSFIK